MIPESHCWHINGKLVHCLSMGCSLYCFINGISQASRIGESNHFSPAPPAYLLISYSNQWMTLLSSLTQSLRIGLICRPLSNQYSYHQLELVTGFLIFYLYLHYHEPFVHDMIEKTIFSKILPNCCFLFSIKTKVGCLIK